MLGCVQVLHWSLLEVSHFFLLHPQLACKQQPDLMCAVLVLIELYFAQVSNANPLFAGQWNGCHDIYTTWNAVLYRR